MSDYQLKPETFEVSENNQLYFTSDLHYFHKRIVEFTGRPTTFENLTQWITTQCNNKIPKPEKGKKVTTIHLGDFAFSCTNEELVEVLKSLNGDWWFILGNHDSAGKLISAINKINAETGSNHRLLGWYYRLLVTKQPVDKTKKKSKKLVILCHFPIEDWESKHYNSAMIHGHCVDMETEILTESGWKFRRDLLKTDKIYSLNKSTGLLELESINEIVDLKGYSGRVFEHSTRKLNFRFTENHTVLYQSRGGSFKELFVKDFNSVKKIPLNSVYTQPVLNTLSDDLIKLYVYLVSDGNIKHETNLCRIAVKKEHKQVAIKNVLNSLKISFKEYHQKDGSTSYNFYLPKELLKYNIKGLDNKILTFSEKQTEVFINAYLDGDGCKAGDNCIIIYTSKPSEVSLISHLCSINGYKCSVLKRTGHGFSNGDSYQLSCTKNSFIHINPENIKETFVESEDFWCVKVNNQNFIMRREGKVHITGNCHGGGSDHDGHGLTRIPNRFDVGIDNSHTWSPFSYDDLRIILRKTRGEDKDVRVSS